MSKRSGATELGSIPEGTEAVDKFVRELEHPLKPVLEAVRKTILGAHPGIGEGIKWNSPSFYFKDYFATAGPRSKDFVQVVFHCGAKVKDNSNRRNADQRSERLVGTARQREVLREILRRERRQEKTECPSRHCQSVDKADVRRECI